MSTAEQVTVVDDHRRFTLGVRQRSVLSAVLVVGLALLAGGGLLLFALQSALINSTRGTLEARARDVAVLTTQQGLATVGRDLQQDRIRGQQVQIIDPQGAVVASSDARLTDTLDARLHPSDGKFAESRISSLGSINDDDDYLVIGYGFEVDRQPYVVQVASTIQIQSDTIRTVGILLLSGAPLLLLVVGVAVWVLVGRSLKIVEQIRTQVARINSARLNERVGVPGSRDEIESLAITMNTMLDRLEASDRAQRAFVSDASHELRSPISTLVITGEVAAADPTGQTWVEMQDIVLAESRRMRALVEDLLILAKVDAQGLPLQMVDVDLDDVLDAEVRRLRAASDLQVRTDLAPVRIVGDPVRLTQVFRNIVDNAMRHARSTIVLTVQEDHEPDGGDGVGVGADGGGRVRVMIDNDGAPIGADERGRIFQRFVRLDDARSRDSGGSGLGLAISAAIVDGHRGRIEVTETDQGWCRFVVTLPLPPA